MLYSGGVNRLAIEPVLKEFADREGVDLTTVYNGCGILCASMKAMGDTANPKFPDVYYACDVCFVPPVAEQFPEAVLLTETAIVIAVPEGNPAGIKTLSDLARGGLRVGLCNAEQSTLGFMTSAMLRQTGLLESVRKNVVVEVPTADFLVNQMRAGSLDAIVVYEVNVAPHPEHFDLIPLPESSPRRCSPSRFARIPRTHGSRGVCWGFSVPVPPPSRPPDSVGGATERPWRATSSTCRRG